MIGLLVLLVIAVLVVLWLLWRPRGVLFWQSINVDGLERRYLVRSSNDGGRRKPLLLCFHGGRAQVELLARRSGIAEAAQHRGCMVIFPEARDGWVDLRPERGGSPRDLDFVDALLELGHCQQSNRSGPHFCVRNLKWGAIRIPVGMRAPAPFRGLCDGTVQFACCGAVPAIRPAGSHGCGVRQAGSDHALARWHFAARSRISCWRPGHVCTSNGPLLG